LFWILQKGIRVAQGFMVRYAHRQRLLKKQALDEQHLGGNKQVSVGGVGDILKRGRDLGYFCGENLPPSDKV
jgi:hypothetical protein